MIIMKETMTVDEKSHTSENKFDSWTQAKRAMKSVFTNLTNSDFYDLKHGVPLEVRTGRVTRVISLREEVERNDPGQLSDR